MEQLVKSIRGRSTVSVSTRANRSDAKKSEACFKTAWEEIVIRSCLFLRLGRLWGWMLTMFVFVTGVFAQDQIELVLPPAKLLPSQVKYPDGATKETQEVIRLLGDRTEYQAAARALIAATLASSQEGQSLISDPSLTRVLSSDLDDPRFSCIIHVLKWKDTEMAIDQEQWFTYQGGRWSAEQFFGLRIFGNRRVALLAIHLNARGMSSDRIALARIKTVSRAASAALSAKAIDTAAQALLKAVNAAATETPPQDSNVQTALESIRKDLEQVHKQAGATWTNATRAVDEATAATTYYANSVRGESTVRAELSTRLAKTIDQTDKSLAAFPGSLSLAKQIDLTTLGSLANAAGVKTASDAFTKAIEDVTVPGFSSGAAARVDFDSRLASNLVPSATGDNFVYIAREDLAITFPFSKLAYRIDVTKKLPAPVSNLLSLINFAGQGDEFNKEAPEPIAIWGGRLMDVRYVPSDMVVRLNQAGDVGNVTQLSQHTYDNEGRYFWDVSIALPVNQLKQVEYTVDAATNQSTVSAKTIDRQKILGMLNLYWPPVDTKGTKFSLIPHPVFGLALSSRPLDRIVVGGSVGLNRFQIFAGVAFNRVRVPQTLQVGDAATDAQLQSDLVAHTDKKFVVGLNLPLRQVLDALKSQK